MKTRFTLFFIVALLYISQATMFAQSTLYVSPTGGNIAPYSSWADAATNIQTAVDAASTGDLVLVDDGTYVLSTNVSITKGITVKSVNGYSASIVDGNNATRCFYINHPDAVLDGFTIQNGYNPGGFGGNVNIVTGGTVQNCFITGGQARDGGGVAIDNSGLVVDCIIVNNIADNNSNNGYGGGIRLLNGGTARNCLVYDNESKALGGGINIWAGGTIENCTVVNNTGPNGAGIRLRGTATMRNTISYFNNGDNVILSETSGKTLTNNCITPALPIGTDNITDDPLFEDYASNDFHLTSSSTLINAGLNQAWMTGAYDIDGNDRILESTVDIGAYEFVAGPSIISDDFYPETTLQSFWTFYDPVGDVTLNMNGTNANIEIPSGTDHDLYSGSGNNAPRILQAAPDEDFQIEVKFESVPSSTYQLQGLIVQEDNDTFIRFGHFYGNGLKFFVAVIDGSIIIQTPAVATITTSPPYLRVTRTGDDWLFEYSSDGSNWNTASSFTQAFTVNQVGFYGGNAGSNPPYIASADYFMSSDDPITDTDTQITDPPTIEVWYGDSQTFGNLGNPQQWVNILGRVSDDNGVASLSYSLNGAPNVPLSIGPNTTRLVGNGDFVTEIDYADINNGANTVEFTATDALGGVATKTVTLNYNAGNVWPIPYTADWSLLSNIDSINNIANIVDGLWELTPDGIHTVESGYDRLFVMGDETWTTNYEVTAEMTIHSASSGSGVGFAIGWQGHTGTASPRTEWPLEAIGWVRNLNTLEILTYTSGSPASTGFSISPNTKYLLKAKSEDIGGGNSRFSVKIWEDGTTEPASYMITADIADRDGSVLFITHRADVTWGTIQIDPITGNQPPQFTSSPITNAQVDQTYTYNVTASDPNAGEVLIITAPTLPSWLTLNDNGDGSAVLSGTPTNANLGTHSVQLVVDDGNGETAEQNFTITVTPDASSLPFSDQFCGPDIESFWTIYDPYDAGAGTQSGESSFGINNGVFEISIPGNEGSHDLSQNLAPRVLQTVPDDDFGVEVKFNSVPSTQYQMQGIIVQGTGYRLRFETYYGTQTYFYAWGYGAAFGSAINTPIGGPIPAYLRVTRTGDDFAFDYSYDGSAWTNIVTRTIPVTVAQVGFYGANHTPNPAFTVQAEYFRNTNDPIPNCKVVEVNSPNGGEIWTSGSTEVIEWTSNDIDEIDIEFSADNGLTWNTVANSVPALDGTYNFTVPNINSADCLIRIKDSDDSNVFDVSDNVFTIVTVAGDPTIRIGSAISYGGATITIPVEVDLANEIEIENLLQGKINYDPAKLTFKYGDYGTGTLLNSFGWTGVYYSVFPGSVEIILSGQNEINQNGVLFYLTFSIKDLNAGSTDITSASGEWSINVLSKPFMIENGNVTYSSAPAVSGERGDATLNFVVDYNDALSILYHIIGLWPLSGQAFINADVNYDLTVNIDDYLSLVFYIFLHDWNFIPPIITTGTSIQFSETSGSYDVFEIPINLANSVNAYSSEVSFNYDENIFEFQGYTSSLNNGSSVVKAFKESEGKVTFISASSEKLTGNMNLGSVLLKHKEGTQFDESLISTIYKLNNGVETEGSTIKISGGVVTSAEDEILPKDYALYQNFPNPFNPSTNIKYEIPKSSYVKLIIYNILGSQVQTLVDENQSAGVYDIIFDASNLPSGIYFYKLDAGETVITKKMVLIK